MDAMFEVQAVMSLVDMITGPLRHIRAELNGTGTAAASLATRMGDLASSMLPVAAAAGGVLLGLGKAVNVAMDFEHGLSRLAAVSGATEAEMKALENSAMDLGAATAFSAAQALRAQEDLAKGGFTVNEILGAMPGVLSLAAAGDLDLAQATEIASDTLKTFGLKASDMGMVADVLSKTANAASTDVSQMGQTLKNAGTSAAAARVSLAELSAMAGKMSDMGIKGVEAGTQLKTMLLRLQGPTGVAAKTLKDLGVATKDTAGNMLPIFDILKNLETALAGMGTADRSEKLKTIFGDDAINAVNALLNTGIDKVRTFADVLKNSTGSAAETAARMLNDLKGAIQNLSGSWETLQISVGMLFLEGLKDAALAATRLVNVLTALARNPVGQWLIRTAAYLSAAVVGVTALAAGAWAASWVWGVFVSSLAAVGAALAALAWPILALAAAVAVVYVAWRNNLGGIADTVSGWYQKISLVVRGVIAVFGSLKGSVGTIEGDLAKEIRAAGLEGLVTTVAKVVSRIKAFFAGAWDGLSTGWNMAVAILKPALEGLIHAFKPLADGITAVTTLLFGAMASTDTSGWKLLGEVIGTLVGGAFSLLAGVLSVIVYAVTDVVAIINVLGSAIGTAAGWVVVKFEEIASVVRTVVEWVSGAAARIAEAWSRFSLAEWVEGLMARVMASVGGLLMSVAGKVSGMIQELAAAFQNMDPVEWLRSGFNAVMDYLGGINLFESGAKIIGTLVDGIKSKYTALKGAVSSVFSSASSLLPHSDAREGPFSRLTDSGRAILTTLGQGIAGAAPGFKRSLATAMEGAAAVVKVDVREGKTDSVLKTGSVHMGSPLRGLPLPDARVLGGPAGLAGAFEAAMRTAGTAIPKIEHPAGVDVSWHLMEPGVPVLPRLTARAGFDVVSPVIPRLPDLTGTARYDVMLPEGEEFPTLRPESAQRSAAGLSGRGLTADRGDSKRGERPERKIVIQNLTVQLPQVQNGNNFMSQLKAYLEQFDV